VTPLTTTRFLVSYWTGSAWVDRVVTTAQLAELMGDTVRNRAAADQAIGASVTAYFNGSALAVPSYGLKATSQFYWMIAMGKTNAGTAALVANLRIGTAGTTADTSRVQFTFPASTNAADEGVLEVWANMVSVGAGSGGVIRATARLTHSLATTGFINVPSSTISPANSAGFDTTVAGLILGLSITTGASQALTARLVQAYAENL
jgi:hypothetical protein